MGLKSLFTIFLIALMMLTSGCLDNEPNTPDNLENDGFSEPTEPVASVSNDDSASEMDYRQEMRDFVIGISTYSKQKNPYFIIIPQNGQELLTSGGDSNDPIAKDYIAAIDGVGREDLFFGYDDDNVPTDEKDTERIFSMLDIARDNGVAVMVTDYC